MSVRELARSGDGDGGARLRIGELSRRTGVATATLRAWERRYGLLEPQRSDGNYRLYGALDEARVRAMTTLIDEGLSAGEAARLALARASVSAAPAAEDSLPEIVRRLRGSLEGFDELETNALLDDVLSVLSLEAALRTVLLPVMREIGRRWERGEASVAQEHFATGVVRARLLALARNWGAGPGPTALLACPPDEQHDLGLLAFGLTLRDRGWRIIYLGADTPCETVMLTATTLEPRAVVLAALSPDPLDCIRESLAELAAACDLYVGGSGANRAIAGRVGARMLAPDSVDAAISLDLARGG